MPIIIAIFNSNSFNNNWPREKLHQVKETLKTEEFSDSNVMREVIR